MAGIFRPYDVAQDYQNVEFVKVSTDTLEMGYAVVANAIAGTYLSGEGSLYTPVKPTAVTVANVAVVCPEEYYEDSMGNRLNITDPTVQTYATGSVIRILRPALNKHYFMSNGLITGTIAAGAYLVPTANAYGWTIAADLTGNPKTAFVIEEINIKDTFAGLAAVTGVKLRCVRVLGE